MDLNRTYRYGGVDRTKRSRDKDIDWEIAWTMLQQPGGASLDDIKRNTIPGYAAANQNPRFPFRSRQSRWNTSNSLRDRDLYSDSAQRDLSERSIDLLVAQAEQSANFRQWYDRIADISRNHPHLVKDRPLFTPIGSLDIPFLQLILETMCTSSAYYLLDVIATLFLETLKGWGIIAFAVVLYVNRWPQTPQLILWPAVIYLLRSYLLSFGGLNLFFALSDLIGRIFRRILFYLWAKGIDGDSPRIMLRDMVLIFVMMGMPSIFLISSDYPDTSDSPFPLFILSEADWTLFGFPIATAFFCGFIALYWHKLFRRVWDSRVWVYYPPFLVWSIGTLSLQIRKEILLLTNRLKAYYWTRKLNHLKRPPLDRNASQIRLLEIPPRQKNGPLVVQFVVKSIKDKPSFEAISHRWTVKHPTWIQVNFGKETGCLMVSAQVYSMLRSLQYSDGRTRTIWVDSICINQNDEIEKNWQMGLMRDIYSTASNVIGWMGDSPSTAGALSFASRMLSVVDHGSYSEKRHYLIDWQRRGEYHPGWHSVRSLLGQEWFARVWIIQEVALASNFILRHGGGEELAWDELANLRARLFQSEYEPCLRDPLKSTTGGVATDLYVNMNNLGLLDLMRKSHQVNPEGSDLSSILSLARSFNASDTRDKIYGLLGLTWQETRLSLPVSSKIPLGALLKEVAKKELLSKRFGSLHLAGNPFPETESKVFRKLNLPSWCQDWFSKKHEKPVVSGQYRRATSDLKGYVEPDVDNEERLWIRGIDFDEVSSLSLGGPLEMPSDLRKWKKAWESIRDFVHYGIKLCSKANLREHYCDETPNSLFWRTAFTDMLEGEENVTHIKRSTIRKVDKTFQFVMKVMKDRRLATDLTEGKMQELADMQMKLMMMLGVSASYKRLCLTREGYVCLVPPVTQRGDRICLISGAGTPFVVRLSSPGSRVRESVNRLVGSCYVHGISNGELIGKGGLPPERDMLFE